MTDIVVGNVERLQTWRDGIHFQFIDACYAIAAAVNDIQPDIARTVYSDVVGRDVGCVATDVDGCSPGDVVLADLNVEGVRIPCAAFAACTRMAHDELRDGKTGTEINLHPLG